MTVESETRVVLVADDDAGFRRTLVEVLAEEGYEVIAAADGAAALHDLEKADAVVLDWSMPGLGGAGFCRARRERPDVAAVPILVLTGDRQALEEARAEGVARVLAKPVRLVELLDALGEVCGAP